MANVKFVAVSQPLSGILHYVTNREKTDQRLISGVNCVAESAYEEFTATSYSFTKPEAELTITSCRRLLPTILLILTQRMNWVSSWRSTSPVISVLWRPT